MTPTQIERWITAVCRSRRIPAHAIDDAVQEAHMAALLYGPTRQDIWRHVNAYLMRESRHYRKHKTNHRGPDVPPTA